jgi:3-deoxy-D-manno-octulosonate 8-phosphate phosphatase (KDO 8-P phosphatase)
VKAKSRRRNGDWKKRARSIRLLLLDVDGVLTDGRLMYDGTGREYKTFHIRDGQGITLLQRAGIKVGLLSGRSSSAVRIRARELGIQLIRQKVVDKCIALKAIGEKERMGKGEICFLGDDLIDLPAFGQVGFAVAVADAAKELKTCAHYVTRKRGGQGAVRELCELILKAQGKWQKTIRAYFPKPSSN